MLLVRVYVVLVKGKGVFGENKFNDQMITFKNFFIDKLNAQLNPATAFTRDERAAAAAVARDEQHRTEPTRSSKEGTLSTKHEGDRENSLGKVTSGRTIDGMRPQESSTYTLKPLRPNLAAQEAQD